MLELKKSVKRVLILSAHPDDETLGCGGAISNLSRKKNIIDLITFTDGVSSRNKNGLNRNLKLEKVSKILGINNFNSGNFPDNAMDSIKLLDVCKFIEENVNYEPDIIFTHFSDDLNVDHRIVSRATFTVFRPQYGHKTKIFSYYIPSSTDYNPTSSFDGNSYFRLDKIDLLNKIEALKLYDNEMRKYPHSRSYENIENLIKVWGAEIGVKYAEKFKLIREVI